MSVALSQPLPLLQMYAFDCSVINLNEPKTIPLAERHKWVKVSGQGVRLKEIVNVNDVTESVESIGNGTLRVRADSSIVSNILTSQREMNVTSKTWQSSEEKVVGWHMGGKRTKQPRPQCNEP